MEVLKSLTTRNPGVTSIEGYCPRCHRMIRAYRLTPGGPVRLEVHYRFGLNDYNRDTTGCRGVFPDERFTYGMEDPEAAFRYLPPEPAPVAMVVTMEWDDD